jgi:hypothetical protein
MLKLQHLCLAMGRWNISYLSTYKEFTITYVDDNLRLSTSTSKVSLHIFTKKEMGSILFLVITQVDLLLVTNTCLNKTELSHTNYEFIMFLNALVSNWLWRLLVHSPITWIKLMWLESEQDDPWAFHYTEEMQGSWHEWNTCAGKHERYTSYILY